MNDQEFEKYIKQIEYDKRKEYAERLRNMKDIPPVQELNRHFRNEMVEIRKRLWQQNNAANIIAPKIEVKYERVYNIEWQGMNVDMPVIMNVDAAPAINVNGPVMWGNPFKELADREKRVKAGVKEIKAKKIFSKWTITQHGQIEGTANGEWFRCSPVKESLDVDGIMYVKTRSGSIYQLDKPENNVIQGWKNDPDTIPVFFKNTVHIWTGKCFKSGEQVTLFGD